MKFGNYLQEHIIPEFMDDTVFPGFESSMIRYKVLKQMIRKMDFATSHQRSKEAMPGECCICFEPFHHRSEAISTRCGHDFHPCCLIDAFSVEGSRGNCPLCRAPVAELVPPGFDGDVLRFLAMVRVNIDAADSCHERFVRHLRSHAKTLQDALTAPRAGTFRRFLPSWGCDARRRGLVAEAALLRSHVAAAERFAAANCDGFRKILQKFDSRSGARPLSPHVLPRLASRGFARDADDGPCAGRLAALRSELTRAFHLPPEERRPTPPPPRAAPVGCAASAARGRLHGAQGGPFVAG